ncbi:MAG: hypothetical protein K8T91_03885 [Planctomycetes bacterium]|nr:hypothetical protein [Planctomycetota bacterium]
MFISAIVAFPIYVRYSQVIYLILDRNVGVRESLQLSRQMMKGQMKQIIFLQAAIWGIGISGFFFCFFPVFGTLAFSEIALIVLYQRMLRKDAVT